MRERPTENFSRRSCFHHQPSSASLIPSLARPFSTCLLSALATCLALALPLCLAHVAIAIAIAAVDVVSSDLVLSCPVSSPNLSNRLGLANEPPALPACIRSPFISSRQLILDGHCYHPRPHYHRQPCIALCMHMRTRPPPGPKPKPKPKTQPKTRFACLSNTRPASYGGRVVL